MTLNEVTYLREVEEHYSKDVVERIKSFSGDRYLQRITEKLHWMNVSLDGLVASMGTDELITCIDSCAIIPSRNHYELRRFAWYRESAWLNHETDDLKINQIWTEDGELARHRKQYWDECVEGREVLPENRLFVDELFGLIENDELKDYRKEGVAA